MISWVLVNGKLKKNRNSCFCIHSARFCLLVGAFNPFTFKVITDKYDPVAIYFIVLDSTILRQDTLLLYNPKDCREGKKVCPFFLLENSRPLSPWGPLDSLSTCLGNNSLSHDLVLSSHYAPWSPAELGCFLNQLFL